MDVLGIDISKKTFDVALLLDKRVRQAAFSNTEAGFVDLRRCLAKHRPLPDAPLHACMDATGNYGWDLAEMLHEQGVQVSVVNPLRIKAHGQSELARNKTDKLDAALIALFCRAHLPTAWMPPASHLRELRELMRRADGLKAIRVQEINRQKSSAVVAADPVMSRHHALLLTIPGIGPVTAPTLLAELPNIAEFTPKRLAAFAGLSRQEHSSGTTVRQSGRISRMGSERLRRALYMCALSSKRRNPALAAFVGRMTAAGKAPKVILLAIACKLLVFAHAIVRTQKPFTLLTAVSIEPVPAVR